METKPLYMGDGPTAKVHMLLELFKDALGVPPHTEILDFEVILDDENPNEGALIVTVRHRDIPPEMAGKLIQGRWDIPPRRWCGWRLIG
jgi:hypothetical protein